MSISNTFNSRRTSIAHETDYEDYDDFKSYLHELADELFPFPSFNDYQDEILYETLEAYLIDDYLNVVVEGPTGIGKSAINVTVPRVLAVIAESQSDIEANFGVNIRHLNDGSAFYTTPQKSLRNQLANDDDLKEAITMLKGRRDYTCAASGDNCQDCFVKKDPDMSCVSEPDCTYWDAKEEAMQSHIATITFAMLIVDNYLPPQDPEGNRLSFKNRDLVVVDECHNAEGQSASLFAGFALSPWTLPIEVYGDAGGSVGWNAERMEDVEEEVREIHTRAQSFVDQYENDLDKEPEVEKCENMLRKIEYALSSWEDGNGWVVNIDSVSVPGSKGSKTKKIQLKPVRVHDFLERFVWSRGRRTLITSATIPFRGNIGKWGDRIGIGQDAKFISKPTPFPEEHRKIHLNTMVGKMDSNNEDDNWADAMAQLQEIHSHHEGEKGVVHSVSYSRAERIGKAFGSEAIVDQSDRETDAMMTMWQNSDADIFVSPSVTEGVDLHTEKARWQALLKVSFNYLGDSRVNYLCYEENEWDWYMEEAAMDTIQAVGRAVRGPEPDEAASFYVVDEKFDDVMHRTNPPEYFVEAVRDDPPEHWDNPDAAPWR